MTKSLQSRKRQLVRDAIYDAAIELFAKKGFDETTVEEVADAAGISRRSFFRYFESKDDLLAVNTMICGEVVRGAVASCPAGLGLLDVVREGALAGGMFTENQEHTRQIIDIAQRSSSARQAHQSRLMEVEQKLTTAFASRLKSTSQYSLKPYLLSAMTMAVLNGATVSWYMKEHKELSKAVRQALLTLTNVFCDESAVPAVPDAGSNRNASSSIAPKKARNIGKKN
ncbi:MAG TPA: TetR family transcriptional regulator [Terracidiphilus sp.]|nr:TetR family transcriptional regulator [Terracidiphilus sp.]